MFAATLGRHGLDQPRQCVLTHNEDIPSSYSTFGDATRTEGAGSLRKYVLAQFRSDAEMAWMSRLRAELGAPEVKFKLFKERRPGIRQKSELWKQIEKGVGQAALVVIDPEPLDRAIRSGYRAEGAELGVDFADADVTSRAASALVAGTPLAWLPAELAKVVGHEIETLEKFAPADIQARIGAELRAATVFAARAHATFDVAVLDETLGSTRDVFRSPLARLILHELLATRRTFDNEDSKTVAVLNEASEHIAGALAAELPCHETISAEPLVKEADSHAIDHIQAADVAAGWAREVIDSAGVLALGARFERVWVNGVLLKGPGMALYDVRE